MITTCIHQHFGNQTDSQQITDLGQLERAVSSRCSANHDSDGFTSTQAVGSLEAEVTDTNSDVFKGGLRLAHQKSEGRHSEGSQSIAYIQQ
jgi:hypothetical protein